jgi:hypothetical protein
MARSAKPTRQRACEGKQAHPTRAAAVAHLKALQRSGAWTWQMCEYRCRFCTKPCQPSVWHVGHRPGSRR